MLLDRDAVSLPVYGILKVRQTIVTIFIRNLCPNEVSSIFVSVRRFELFSVVTYILVRPNPELAVKVYFFSI